MINCEERADARILSCNGLALIQDSGRRGVQHLGLAEGGAVDGYAYFWSNQLVGNNQLLGHSYFASIEVTLGPFALEFEAPTLMAISGAEMNPQLNGCVIPTWQTQWICAGDVLSLSHARVGLRTYISVAGGFQVKRYFGSCSSVVREGLLNIGAAPLKSKQKLAYHTSNIAPKQLTRSLMPDYIPQYNDELVLRILPGYQYDLLSTAQQQQLTQVQYTITPESDRMGYRLHSDSPIQHEHAIISEGIAYGSIQLPPDGQPIVLLNDRQTIGGYPKIGCVLPEDAYQLAQRRPGQKVRLTFLNND